MTVKVDPAPKEKFVNDTTRQAATARDAIERLSGLPSERIHVTIDTELEDGFAAEAIGDVLHITASGAGAAVAGYAAFARRTGVAHVSRIGTRPVDRDLPEREVVTRTAQLGLRIAYNLTASGYTTPFYTWDEWEAEIDLLAASGINAAHVTLGQELAYLRTFTQYGYTEAEVLNWIGAPSHQPWLWLNSIQSYGEGTSRELVEARAALALRVMQRMRELDIAPILPGFSGIVPPGFDLRNEGAPVVDQGLWFMDLAGPQRPDWLDSTSEEYARVAASFYAAQDEEFGAPGMWAVDLLHEGGKTGGADLGEAARGVLRAMTEADPASTWIMQGWIGNPRREVLAGIDRSRVLILDLTGETYDADGGFLGTRWVQGILPNYGGRSALYGDLADMASMPARWVDGADATGELVGLGNMAEGIDNNPVLWDLYSDLAWAEGPVQLEEWLDEWASSRYGHSDDHARAAWRVLLGSGYGPWRHAGVGATTLETQKTMQAAAVDAAERSDDTIDADFFGRIDTTDPAVYNFNQPYMSTDSVIAAVPSLSANQASMVGPRTLGYAEDALVPALRELLAASDHVASPGLDYDIADIARQLADDVARASLRTVRTAAEADDVDGFDHAVSQFLQLVDAQEGVAATNSHLLLGQWIEAARSWGTTPEEGAYLVREAKRLLTSWGGRDAAILIDYANRGWSGLIGDYYRTRWEMWFGQVRNVITGQPTAPIDWFDLTDSWVAADTTYASTPQGSSVEKAAVVLAVSEQILAAARAVEYELPHA